MAANRYTPTRTIRLYRPLTAAQHTVTQTMPQGIYPALNWVHSVLDGAESADRSLTACAIQLYPGYISGENTTAAV